MSALPNGHSARRLIEAVRKLEDSLNSAGLPRFVARLPVCWLSWHYCRVLDNKIARIRRIAGKFEKWRASILSISKEAAAQMEMMDVDRSMRTDIEFTKNAMWELRGYCIDVGRMFEQLGYQSARLKRRQEAFLKILEQSCESASGMQRALDAHDDAVLAFLRAEQLRERAAAAVAAPATAAATATAAAPATATPVTSA
jgi:CRISPR/Cas system CSM-associated protein Csm2 small subunit